MDGIARLRLRLRLGAPWIGRFPIGQRVRRPTHDPRRSLLPPLVEFLPEARLNLVIYHLRSDDIQEAYVTRLDLDLYI